MIIRSLCFYEQKYNKLMKKDNKISAAPRIGHILLKGNLFIKKIFSRNNNTIIEKSHFKCRKTHFKVAEIADITQKERGNYAESSISE